MGKILVLFSLFFLKSALACAVCFAPEEKQATDALHYGLLIMLGVTVLALFLVTRLILKISKEIQ